MQSLAVFLIRNDVWIYIICFLGLVWYLSEFWRGYRSLRQAMFGLERESALRTRNNALIYILIFVGVVSTVAFVNIQVAPTLPPTLLRDPTPTPDPFALPPAPTIEATSNATPTSPLAPTVTLASNANSAPDIETPVPVPDILATDNPLLLPTATVLVGGCSPTVTIIDPREGDIVIGTLTLFGSANIPLFAYYEIEISGPQTNDIWASLLGRRISQRVEEGLLGTADLSGWDSGAYQVRLTTVNEGETATNRCIVTIALDNG